MGIFPTVYEEEDNVDGPEDDEDVTNTSESFEDNLIALMNQEAERQKQKPVVVPVVKSASVSKITPGISLLKPDPQQQPPQDAVTSDLAADSIRQQVQDRQKEENKYETSSFRPSSHYESNNTTLQMTGVKNSNQPRNNITAPSLEEQKLFDTMPKVEAVVKQELGMGVADSPSVKAGPLLSVPDVKPVIKPPPKQFVNPNIIDLTMTVTANPDLSDLLTCFEEESSNNFLLVDWPSPLYIEDYKLLAEGQWLSTHLVDFYLQHLFHQLPSNQQSQLFVFETTFFSVLRDLGLGAVSSYFKDTNFFDKEKIN